MRIARRLAVAAAAPAAAIGSIVALAGAATSHPARDSFTAAVRSGTGAYEEVTGKVRIHLVPSGATAAHRSVVIQVAGRSCAHRARCLSLSGTLRGRIDTHRLRVADLGATYTISAKGRLRPIGHVSLSGSVHGTGFIREGRETLVLSAIGSRGTIDLSGQSAIVGGFTGP